MVLIILIIIGLTVFAFAISCVNQIPQDEAEADLYLRGSIPDWRNNGF